MVERLGARAAEIESARGKAHGLTPAEIRLAAHLVRGGTVSGYAKAHGLSRNTVRNQLQSAYCKTGTHRQAELVALLLKP
jgi:DNA-binding CsgD family transcriptional regulator